MKNALDPEALERALAQARGDADRLAAELNALCTESEATLNDLLRLVERYRDVQEDSAATRARIAAIGASNAWRTLETLRRIKTRFGVARASAGRPRRRGVPAFVRSAPVGVNVAGYLDTESGMGEAARASIRSLEAAGIPVALNNVASRLRKQDTSYARAFVDDNPHPFNLVHLNADNMGWFAEGRGRRYFTSRYTIGYWFWELADFREEWVPFFDYVDEVWAASDFVRDAYAAWSPGTGRAHAPSGRAAVVRSTQPLAFQAAAGRHGVSLRLRRFQPDRAQESGRSDRGIPSSGISSRPGRARAQVHQR